MRKYLPEASSGKKYGCIISFSRHIKAPNSGFFVRLLLKPLSQLQFHIPQGRDGVHNFVEVFA